MKRHAEIGDRLAGAGALATVLKGLKPHAETGGRPAGAEMLAAAPQDRVTR
ncbi:hypothetical protein GCM10023196_085510 [Actinoallomurus vinaceus]|uniref:Uncharacterized protein n=1 Tax=Actinoallomurus vinaceus TaxID=1080074 RepID=A0ABP8UNX3_9ACTN